MRRTDSQNLCTIWRFTVASCDKKKALLQSVLFVSHIILNEDVSDDASSIRLVSKFINVVIYNNVRLKNYELTIQSVKTQTNTKYRIQNTTYNIQIQLCCEQKQINCLLTYLQHLF